MRRALDIALPVSSIALVALGGYWGLALAPREAMMGEVYRVMFVHVPIAMMALLAPTVCFIASLVYLLRSGWLADAVAEAAAEVGVVLGGLCLVTGSIWARPTWGTWWTWDPRLTSVAILWIAFCGYLALRRFVDSPEKRATWSAVAAIIISVDVPIVYFSVKWWNSIHQMQSNPNTIDSSMVTPLRINITAFFLVFWWLLYERTKLARARQAQELTAPPELAAAGGAP